MISTSLPGFHLARRRTRRWIVAAYWAYALFLAVALAAHQVHHQGLSALSVYWMFFLLLILTPFLGGVRVGGLVKSFGKVRFVPLQERPEIQPLLSPPKLVDGQLDERDFRLDERETVSRDHCHFLAYTWIRWGSLALLALYCGLGLWQPATLALCGPIFLYLLTLTLWSLPQSLLLWSEPDMEAEA